MCSANALCVFPHLPLSPILKTLNITSTDKETWGTKKFRKLPRVTELISSQQDLHILLRTTRILTLGRKRCIHYTSLKVSLPIISFSFFFTLQVFIRILLYHILFFYFILEYSHSASPVAQW